MFVLVLAVPASAATVERTKLIFDFQTVDFGCGFAVIGDFTDANEYATDFYDNDGTLVKSIISGKLVVTLSNPDNGKSIVENSSSSEHVDWVSNRFIITGRSDIFSYIVTGRVDVDKYLTDGTFNGHISDEVCKALA
jgi:hypothetical protein